MQQIFEEKNLPAGFFVTAAMCSCFCFLRENIMKKMIKKIALLLAICVASLSVLSACGTGGIVPDILIFNCQRAV